MNPVGPTRITCINAATASGTLGVPVKSPGYSLLTFVVQGDGVTSSGVITFEEASWGASATDYTGTWSVITTVNASDVNTGSSSGSAQKFVHISATAGAYVRPRITTIVGGGGTISVFCHAQTT